MLVKKETWHYKLWAFSCMLTKSYVDSQANLCAYFWRLVFSIIFLFPSYYVFNVVRWSLGYRKEYNDFKEKEIWKLKHKNNRVVILLLALMFWGFLPIFLSRLFLKIWIGITGVICFSLALVGIVYVCVRVRESDFWQLVRDYIEAIKGRMCPIILFVRKEKEEK